MGITWTKEFSSSDDGAVLTGAQVGTIQSDIAGKFATSGSGIADADVKGTIGEDKILFSATGHDHSGTTNGKAVGGTTSAITRGFELVFSSTGAVIVNPGTLYHNTTRVDKTATTTLTLATDADWIDGTAPTLTSDIFYIYSDASGNFKLEETAPAYADTAGNTAGTKHYHKEGTTYYFVVGSVTTNAADEIIKFYQRGNWITFDDPRSENALKVTTVTSNIATFTAASCSAMIPTISTSCLLYLYGNRSAAGDVIYQFRPTGSSATYGLELKAYVADAHWIITPPIALNSSQSFDYTASFNNGDLIIYALGYELDTRL